ncbi:hypothetical protein ZWY2020_023923 [Hordeum vulgare]|nr:hypothetical protein ZWY2020_023923 [Hordeum vulgare]
MAPVNRGNTRRSRSIVFLVLVMVFACTMSSFHARGGEPYCINSPLGCSEPSCMEECNLIDKGLHSFYCNHIGQCCCWPL